MLGLIKDTLRVWVVRLKLKDGIEMDVEGAENDGFWDGKLSVGTEMLGKEIEV